MRFPGRAFPVVALMVTGAVRCASNVSPEPDTTTGADPLAAYYLTPALCTDASGPDCTKLRLGDAYFSTTQPASGTLYSCNAANPSAPGSIASRITWINTTAG